MGISIQGMMHVVQTLSQMVINVAVEFEIDSSIGDLSIYPSILPQVFELMNWYLECHCLEYFQVRRKVYGERVEH